MYFRSTSSQKLQKSFIRDKKGRWCIIITTVATRTEDIFDWNKIYWLLWQAPDDCTALCRAIGGRKLKPQVKFYQNSFKLTCHFVKYFVGSAIYANRHYLELSKRNHPERLQNNFGCTIIPNVYIHPSASVHPTAVLGPNVSISRGNFKFPLS